MNNLDAERRLNYIDYLFSDFSNRSFDTQMESHIAQYLTVLISGVFEDVIKNYAMNYIEIQTTPPEAKDYIKSHIEKEAFRNPDRGNVKKFLKRFSQSWVDSLEDNLLENNWTALENIVRNKNLIAHGRSSNVTFNDIKGWYMDSKIVIISLDGIII